MKVLLILLFAILLAGIPVGAFYLKKQVEIPISANPDRQSLSKVASANPSMNPSQQGTPLGPETENFFEKVIESKGQAYENQLNKAVKTGNRITYKNDQFGYQFSYPATWALPQMSMGDPDFHIFYQDLFLTFKNANQLDKNAEKNYCDDNNRDSRCETLSLNNTKAVIDWGTSGSEKALVTIPHPTKKLQAVFELQPITDLSKKSFKDIISTFEFN